MVTMSPTIDCQLVATSILTMVVLLTFEAPEGTWIRDVEIPGLNRLCKCCAINVITNVLVGTSSLF